MPEIIIQNIDPNVLHRLEDLAQLHGRSLQEEIKHILESVAQTENPLATEEFNLIYRKTLQMQQQLADHHGNQTPSRHENSIEGFNVAIGQLEMLKQTISSLRGFSIREAIEEGRRF